MVHFKSFITIIILLTLFLNFAFPADVDEEVPPDPLAKKPRCVDKKITNHIKDFIDMMPITAVRGLLYRKYAAYQQICNFVNRFKGNLGSRMYWARLYKHPETRMLLLYLESFDVDTLAVMVHIFKYLHIDYWRAEATTVSCNGYNFAETESIPMYTFWSESYNYMPIRKLSQMFELKMDCSIFNEFLSNLNFFYIIKYLKRLDQLTPFLMKFIFREGYNPNWFMYHWGLLDIAPYQKKVGAKENITEETTTAAPTTPPSTTPDYYSAG